MALKMNKSKTTKNPLCIPRGEDGKIRTVPFAFRNGFAGRLGTHGKS